MRQGTAQKMGKAGKDLTWEERKKKKRKENLGT